MKIKNKTKQNKRQKNKTTQFYQDDVFVCLFVLLQKFLQNHQKLHASFFDHVLSES